MTRARTTKATDVATARLIVIADELASVGARAPLIRQLTGFGERWVRNLVRRSKAARPRRMSDAALWLDQDPQRLVDTSVFMAVYGCQLTTDPEANRLLRSYRAYRAIKPGAALDINRCAQVIELCRLRTLRSATCRLCGTRYLALPSDAMCPVCRMLKSLEVE